MNRLSKTSKIIMMIAVLLAIIASAYAMLAPVVDEDTELKYDRITFFEYVRYKPIKGEGSISIFDDKGKEYKIIADHLGCADEYKISGIHKGDYLEIGYVEGYSFMSFFRDFTEVLSLKYHRKELLDMDCIYNKADNRKFSAPIISFLILLVLFLQLRRNSDKKK